ncbi:hypothetical protein D3C71_1880140 [compost metagenome]
MAWERMDITNTLHAVFRHGSPAHTLAYRNTYAGDFPLERTEHQLRAIHQIKTCPIDVIKALVDQRTGVGQRGDKVGFPVKQRAQITF